MYMECQGCCTVYEASAHARALAADGDKGYCGMTQRFEVQLFFSQEEDGWPADADMVNSCTPGCLPSAQTMAGSRSASVLEVNLACGTLGPAIAKALFHSGEILSLTRDHVTPFYRERSQQTLQWFREALGDLPWRCHKPEGAIFLWLWFEGLPITSQELYQRLKRRGVLIVPGHNFFVGLADDWPHKQECIRVSYAQDAAVVKQGVQLIAEEVRLAYEGC